MKEIKTMELDFVSSERIEVIQEHVRRPEPAGALLSIITTTICGTRVPIVKEGEYLIRAGLTTSG